MAESNLSFSKEYRSWFSQLKQKYQQTQIKASTSVNTHLLSFYWELGYEIVERQQSAQWGSGFLKQLSADLIAEYPETKGFSYNNLAYIKRWYLFYHQNLGNPTTACGNIESVDSGPASEPKVAQLVPLSDESQISSQLVRIPWGHNRVIISKCSSIEEALYYVRQTITHGWSRAVLVHQIESDLYSREGSATSNFSTTLPPAQSDLAQQTLKDPYIFDFLTLTKDHNERDLENQLTDHISKFLIELGAGFAYLGRQVPLEVSDRDFYLDLLFYHTQLHCYVVIELKTGDFEPEFAGKLNFYLKAVDETLRSERDEPTIGILICKSKDKLIADYALSDISKPIGVSEYQLTKSLPENLKPRLPSIEELENELQPEFDDER